MKIFFGLSLLLFLFCLALDSSAHYTGKGHVHIVSETKRDFLNPDCRSTDTCDLKRFSLTTSAYEVWFADDPHYPSYVNGAVMEYETDSVAALEKYAVVQFKKGCVFYSEKNRKGKIIRTVNNRVPSFGEDIPFCFKDWVIDSQDTDPAYNSDPEYGRHYFLRWNKPGSYDDRTQKYYGAVKPRLPVLYMTDYPGGAFMTASGARNVALEFKTCIYRSRDVPEETHRADIHFAVPINCFEWQNVYVYDYEKAAFVTDMAAVPPWDEPADRAKLYLAATAALLLALALYGLSRRRRFFGKQAAAGAPEA